MKALIIGGPRHGEWLDGLFDGTRIWVDIEHATKHVIRKITWNVQNITDGSVLEAYTMYVAVHEAMQGPNEPNVASQLIQLIAMNDYARAHGDRQEIPIEPAGSSLIVPGAQ